MAKAMTAIREMLQWSNTSQFYIVKPTMTCWVEDQLLQQMFTADDPKYYLKTIVKSAGKLWQ